MDIGIVKDSFGWDEVNWSRGIRFWEKHIEFSTDKELKGLELGARFGGLSLLLAENGIEMVCSDLTGPTELTRKIHQKHKVDRLITYEAIDATKIPFENHFDIVCFKSVLGGIGRNGKDELMSQALRQIHKALKPGGTLFFAENLEGSFLHQFARKKFVKWGDEWNYLKMADLDDLFSDFSSRHFATTGFSGAFGRSDYTRNLLGRVDKVTDWLIPPSGKYILFGVAKK